MKLKELILKNYKTKILNSGLLFAEIGRMNVFTWMTEEDGITLDVFYFLQRSGEKELKEIELLDFDEDSVLCSNDTIISNDLICSETNDYFSWVIKYALLKFSNKWNNLSKTLDEDIDYLVNQHYEMKETPNLQVETSNDGNVNTYGFNSPSSVHQSSGDSVQTTTSTGDRTMTYKGLRDGSYSDLIAKEIEILKWNFFETIMSDIDTIITLPKYSY